MRSSSVDGNHQGRIRVVTDTYPMSYRDGSEQTLRCSMVTIPADMLTRSQLAWTKTTITHGRRIRTRERTGARRERQRNDKRILSGRPSRRVLIGAHERKQTKNRKKTFFLGTVAREWAIRTIEQTGLRLFRGGSNARVGLALQDGHTRRLNTEMQC